MDDNAAIEERIIIDDIIVVEESWLDEASYHRRFRPLVFSELVDILRRES
jgi:hypothetical protein